MWKVEEKMLMLRNEEQSVNLSRFFKTGRGEYGEGDKFLGIKVPQTRQVVKECWKDCSFDELEHLVTSEWHEIRLCGLLILVQKYKKLNEEQSRCIEFYLGHTNYINNWDLVDLSCYELLGRWLMNQDRILLYDLAMNGKTLWEKRIAIVTCMQFVRNGDYDDCLKIADILIDDRRDLIEKATGWLLREVGKRDIDLLRDFIMQHYDRMGRTTLRYAIEKMDECERKKWLNYR